MKTRTVLAIALAVSWATASARDYMGMEPIIVDAKEIEGVTSESGETIKILLRAEDTMVFTPRGTVHAWTALEPDSKFILIYTPGGWEHYFESVGQLTEEQRNDEEFMEEYRLSYDSIYFQ